MLPASKTVKRTAKDLMRGKWPQLIAVCCIIVSVYLAVILVESTLQYALGDTIPLFTAVLQQKIGKLTPAVLLCEALGLLLMLFIWGPLFLGAQRWFWRLSGGADDTVGGLFHYFGSPRLYGRAVCFRFFLYLRILLAGLVCFAPAILSCILVSPEFYAAIGLQTPMALADLWSLPGIFAVLGLVAFIPWMLRYYLAAYLLINDPELPPWRALTLSCKVSRGSRAVYLGLLLTFIGWALLCLLALPVFFVLPYLMTALPVFARYAIDNYNVSFQRAPGYGMY